MKRVKEIYNGWKNSIITTPEVEHLAETRNGICNQCEKKGELMGVSVCLECHCPLHQKTRSPDSECPLGKW